MPARREFVPGSMPRLPWDSPVHVRPGGEQVPLPCGSRLDTLPLFVRISRSRSSPGIFDPAPCPGATSGVPHQVTLRGMECRPLG